MESKKDIANYKTKKDWINRDKKEAYHLCYLKTCASIQQNQHYNLISHLEELHDEFNKFKLNKETRGQMMYNILYLIGQIPKYRIPLNDKMNAIHNMIHNEILQLGYKEYVKLIQSLIDNYKSQRSKLLLVTPFIESSKDILFEYNDNGRFVLLTAYLQLQFLYFKTIDLDLLDNLMDSIICKKDDQVYANHLLTEACRIVHNLGYLYDTNNGENHLEQQSHHFALYKKYRKKLHQQIDEILEHYCEEDAYHDTVAFFVNDANLNSWEMRSIYSFIKVLKSLDYKIVLLHLHDIDAKYYKDLFYECIRIPHIYSTIKAKQLLEMRYRVVFYCNYSNQWSLFNTVTRLGITQVGLPSQPITSGCDQMDYYLLPSFDNKKNYVEPVQVLSGMGITITNTVANINSNLKPTSNSKLVFCPWDIDYINTQSIKLLHNIQEYNKNVNILFVFYAMNGLQTYVYQALISYLCDILNIKLSYTIEYHGHNHHYKLYPLVDLVLNSYPMSISNTLVDTIQYKKVMPILANYTDESPYSTKYAKELYKTFKLNDLIFNDVDSYLSFINDYLTDEKFKDMTDKQLNLSSIESIIEKHNSKLEESFESFCESIKLTKVIPVEDSDDEETIDYIKNLNQEFNINESYNKEETDEINDKEIEETNSKLNAKKGSVVARKSLYKQSYSKAKKKNRRIPDI